ncbi:hypothetical protein DFJ74DRAFT_670645 [Hyaloraphidium curvatum]|nr:hypothetical protein DFJ74DRAFT_670645 [Hyaloraphidium curvatum]
MAGPPSSSDHVFGIEGAGHPYAVRDSLPFSAERELVFFFLDVNSTHDLFAGLVNRAFELQNPVFTLADGRQSTAAPALNRDGRSGAPMFVGRDVKVQLHPDVVAAGGDRMVPGNGDRVWGRAYMVEASAERPYFRTEFELRIIARWDPETRREIDLTDGRSTWGSGRERRPGLPFAAGWVGNMIVTRDRSTGRFRVAPRDMLPAANWASRGAIHKSIIADDPAYSWVSRSDGFVEADVAAAEPWTALPSFKWETRRVDNDSLGHTTASRRVLPFFEASYRNLPDHRIAGIFVEYRTELLPHKACTVIGVRSGDTVRYLLDDGAGPGRLNRAAVWIVDKAQMRLKVAGGGPA